MRYHGYQNLTRHFGASVFTRFLEKLASTLNGEFMKSCPSSLYKYQSLTLHALDALANEQVYFAPPSKLNDPYDCGITPIVGVPSVEDMQAIVTTLGGVTVDEFQTSEWGQLGGRERFTEHAMDAARRVLSDRISEFANSRGVTCFAESNSNLLMWSHYADAMRGFCLEFDTSFDLFEKVRPIQYLDRMPTINLFGLLLGTREEVGYDVMSAFFTKSVDWAYEAEWRVLHEKGATLYGYGSDCLKSIYFGPAMTETNMRIIWSLVHLQNRRVKFYRGKRSRVRYEVEFDPYVPRSGISKGAYAW